MAHSEHSTTDIHQDSRLFTDRNNEELIENSKNNNNKEAKTASDNAVEQTPVKKCLRFWVIIGTLAVTGLLTALEATITSTALPTIIESLGGASLYVWVINLYFLTMYGNGNILRLFRETLSRESERITLVNVTK